MQSPNTSKSGGSLKPINSNLFPLSLNNWSRSSYLIIQQRTLFAHSKFLNIFSLPPVWQNPQAKIIILILFPLACLLLLKNIPLAISHLPPAKSLNQTAPLSYSRQKICNQSLKPSYATSNSLIYYFRCHLPC